MYHLFDNIWKDVTKIITKCGVVINIPPEYADTEKYQGTLGHKVNHKFDPNSEYKPVETARYYIVSD